MHFGWPSDVGGGGRASALSGNRAASDFGPRVLDLSRDILQSSHVLPRHRCAGPAIMRAWTAWTPCDF